MQAQPITGRNVLLIAIPVVLSNATVPLQGAVDTAIIGNIGVQETLGGVGIGAQLMAVFVGVFNFVQIGCSGLTAQALGAGNQARMLNTFFRSAVIGLSIALLLIAFQALLLRGGLSFFEASSETEAEATRYFAIRIWGAPFEMLNMAMLGWFAGQGLTQRLFQHQLVTTLSNMALSLLLALGFGWGLVGVAVATVISAAIGALYGAWLVRKRADEVAPEDWSFDLPRILRRSELVGVMRINADIFVRTALLMFSFAWMLRLGSLQEDTILAANVVLWQFFIVSAYALDGFAIAAESLVGQAKGSGDRHRFRRAAIVTSLWSGGLAIAFSLILLVLSGPIIALLTDLPEVRSAAGQYAVWAALVPAIGFAAFQLDGIFIGATASRQMRNSMLVAAGLYLPFSFWMTETFGNHGVWAGIYSFLILRALTLLAFYPALERRVELQSQN